MADIKKTLSAKEYCELLQAKLHEEKIAYEKSFRYKLIQLFILLTVLFLTFPLLGVLPDFIGLLTFSGLVLLAFSLVSVTGLFKKIKKYSLQKKRYNEIISLSEGYDKINFHSCESWFCVTLMINNLSQANNEMIFRYYELNLYQRTGNDIFLMNLYGHLCFIPDNLFPHSKYRRIIGWIEEGMK